MHLISFLIWRYASVRGITCLNMKTPHFPLRDCNIEYEVCSFAGSSSLRQSFDRSECWWSSSISPCSSPKKYIYSEWKWSRSSTPDELWSLNLEEVDIKSEILYHIPGPATGEEGFRDKVVLKFLFTNKELLFRLKVSNNSVMLFVFCNSDMCIMSWARCLLVIQPKER